MLPLDIIEESKINDEKNVGLYKVSSKLDSLATSKMEVENVTKYYLLTKYVYTDEIEKLPIVLMNFHDVSYRVIPHTFYDMSHLLIGQIGTELNELFGTDIFFECYGKIKCLHEIQIDVKTNMLNMYNLVNYQYLYINWLLATVVVSWKQVIDYIIKNPNLNDDEEVSEDLFEAFEFLNDIVKLRYFLLDEERRDIIELFYAYRKSFKIFSSTEKNIPNLNLFKIILLDPLIKSLGVIKSNEFNFDKIVTILKIDTSKGVVQICHSILLTVTDVMFTV